MSEGYELHVISNTHWDREWLYPFQETRMMLVEFMDKLLRIFREEPGYKSYLLDSQTVPLEDYLEIRPERTEEIRALVRDGRLLIGPWYCCPEEFCVTGESLVRNLLAGHKIAGEFGKVMKVGYSPFSYGQTSQMPQIYQGFGIDTILFYHGIDPERTKSEFIFEGPDGTQVLASRMGCMARYNFYFHVYRPVVYGKELPERRYDWRAGGMPFHMCRQGREPEHHFLTDPVREFDKDRVVPSIKHLLELESEHATTRYLAGMQGLDSTEPDPLELRIIEEAQGKLGEHTILHSSLPDWLDKVKKAAKDLRVLKGEQRIAKAIGTRPHLYGDVTSTRTRMKRKSTQAEYALQRSAEPFAACAWALGAEYPQTLLDTAWRYLMRSHPHDSIAGTGVDQIERDMHHRLEQCLALSEGIQRRALQSIQLQIDNSDLAKEDIALTVFNPSPRERSEVLTLFLDLPEECEIDRFSLIDATSGEKADIWEVGRGELAPPVRHLGDATMEMPGLRVAMHMAAERIPALGYRTYALRREERAQRILGTLVTGQNRMENEHLDVEVNPDGTFNLTRKADGKTYTNLHSFQDSGEAGHAWRHVPPAYDRVISSRGGPARITLLDSNPLLARYEVAITMEVPRALDEGRCDMIRRLDADGDVAGRSQDLVQIPIVSTLTLRRDARSLEIETRFDNRAESHRLRAVFPTRLDCSVSHAETAFDVVARDIERPEGHPWSGTYNPTHPHHRFVDCSDGASGLAIVNDGLREYEVTDDADRAIILTLVRGFEIALTTVSWRWEMHPEMPLTQAPGQHVFRYSVHPHEGGWENGVFEEAERLNVPMEAAQAGPHPGHLPKSRGFLEITPENLVLSALKRAENGEGIIVRLFNPTDDPIEGAIVTAEPVVQARTTNLNEEPLEELDRNGNHITLTVASKKIVTVELRL